MSGYTKLFHSILASTIWCADNETRIVWITMLAMADKDGIVEGSIPGLASFARVSVTACRCALKNLSSPDIDSRTKDCDGRRIEAVDGGWRLVNHAKYRAKMGADERREYLRLKQAEYRARKAAVNTASTSVDNVSDTSTASTHAEADTEADTKAKSTRTARDPADDAFARFQAAYPASRRKGGYLTSSLFQQAYEQHGEALFAALENHKASEQWQTPRLIPGMDTWFREERWTQRLDGPEVAAQAAAKAKLPAWAMES